MEYETRKVCVGLVIEISVPKGASDCDINERLNVAIEEGDVSFIDAPLDANAVSYVYVMQKEGESN